MEIKDDRCFVLKENTEEIRKRIKDAGIHVCVCATFIDACWLDFHTAVANGVHGVGYWGEGTNSQEEELARFVAEVKNPVWCSNVEEFIENIKIFEKEKDEQ